MNTRRSILLGMLLALTFSITACGERTYVRGDQEPRLDTYAMSLRLDKVDLDRLYKENVKNMLASPAVKQWERRAAMSNRPVVAIFPIRNETTEHITAQLETLLSKIETDLVNKTPVDVINHRIQPQMIAEIRRQQSAAYDPQRLSRFGRQLGAQYFVTGKIFSNTEQVKGERRVQYSLFMQIIEVETSRVAFQHTSELTKGYIK